MATSGRPSALRSATTPSLGPKMVSLPTSKLSTLTKRGRPGIAAETWVAALRGVGLRRRGGADGERRVVLAVDDATRGAAGGAGAARARGRPASGGAAGRAGTGRACGRRAGRRGRRRAGG